MATGSAEIEVVHAGVRGRLRLRLDAVRRRPERARALASALGAEPGILSAEVRAVTGSALLHFDKSHDAAQVIERVRLLLAALDSVPPATGLAPDPAHGTTTVTTAPPADTPRWWAEPAEIVVERLGGNPADGLSGAEAARRLQTHGRNVMPHDEPPSKLAVFASQFSGLPVMMLAGSATVSLFAGAASDAVATLSVVLINGVIGYVTENEAERVIHTLMGSGQTPVTVLRDGQESTIAAETIVPGDLLVLRPGMQVAADARVIRAEGLYLDESTLTGESFPVRKDASAHCDADIPIGERATMAHAGTIVTEGRGAALVVATAAMTEAARTQTLSSTASRPKAPVEVELDYLGSRLAIGSMAACALFAGIGLWRGYPMSVVLKDALALAVAAVPEGLPMVATTTMSLGLGRMERKGILVREIHAAESLGAVQTICLDKTGTLTQNRITVVEAVTPDGPAALTDAAATAALAEIAALNNDAAVAAGTVTGSSQTEQAILDFARGTGLDVDALRAARPRTATTERAPGRPWMATVHEGARWPVLYKGSPEVILAASSQALVNGEAVAMDASLRAELVAANERLAARPSRVMGFAVSTTPPGTDNTLPRDLVYAGLLGMQDPLRADAPAFIRRLQAAGIRTVLVTGDQAATAGAIAAELDLSAGQPLRIVDSTNLAGIAPELLAALARDAHVFTRVASHQKLAIVQALQAEGHVVAMTGDGVNDGPALNAADVGIAMGRSGADLAREVANVVIRDDRLETLVDAIGEGRALYRNIRRSLEFLVTTNLSEITVSIAEAIHGPSELETPMELLWINMVTDVLPGLGLALAEPDRDVLARPPRPRDEEIIPPHDMQRMALDSSMIAASALGAHFIGLARHGPGPETRAMTFVALSQAQLLYTLVCQRTDPRHLDPSRLLENRRLDLAVLASSGLALLPLFVPRLRTLLGIAPLPPGELAVSLAAAAVPFATVLARRGVQMALVEIENEP